MARWHEELSDNLKLIIFYPSKANPYLWMQDYGYQYEYTNIYSDNLLVFSKIHTVILRGLNTLFLLKVVGDPELYLGGDVVTVEINGEVTHTLLAGTCIKNVSEKIENILKPYSRAMYHHLRGISSRSKNL